MDELDLLRNLRSDVGNLDDVARAAGRTALLERIETTSPGDPNAAPLARARRRRRSGSRCGTEPRGGADGLHRR